MARWRGSMALLAINADERSGRTPTWVLGAGRFLGGRTNLAYNCIDRHVAAGLGARTAFLWEGNDLGVRPVFDPCLTSA